MKAVLGYSCQSTPHCKEAGLQDLPWVGRAGDPPAPTLCWGSAGAGGCPQFPNPLQCS